MSSYKLLSLKMLALATGAFLFVADSARAQLTVESVGGRDAMASEVLVKLRQPTGVSAQQVSASLDQTAQAVQGDKVQAIGSTGAYRIHSKLFSAQQLVNLLSQNPDVEYAEPNYVIHTSRTPDDTYFASQWNMKNTGQIIAGQPGVSLSDISATKAWDKTIGSATIAVGVLDSGIDYTHPDLAANVWTALEPYTITLASGTYNCPVGSHGFNIHDLKCDAADDNYHGSHMAGIIGAAGNNTLGVAGVNWKTSMVALKMLGQYGTGNEADAAAAIDVAVQLKALSVSNPHFPNIRVLNASWEGELVSATLQTAILNANTADILFVTSAGNEGDDLAVTPHYPAAYSDVTLPNLITVAATDNQDKLASFSNYSATLVHLAAPGVNILSTVPTATYTLGTGTSMAAPHVSGAAALVLSACTTWTTAQLKSALISPSNTDPVPALVGKTVSGGRLNVSKVVDSCTAVPVPDFTLTAGNTSVTIAPPGTTGTSNITVTPLNSFSGAVALTVSGLPAGLTPSFATNTIAGGSGSSLLTFTAAGVVAGDYPIVVTGTSGALVTSTLIIVHIANQDFLMSLSANTLTVGAGGTATVTATVQPLFLFGGNVTLSIVGGTTVAPGVTAAFTPSAVITGANGQATITFTAISGALPSADNTVVIQGVSGALTHTVTLTLNVTPAQDFSLAVAPPSVSLGAGSTASATVTSTALYGFAGSIAFSAIGLPPGVTSSFAPPSVTGGGTSLLTLTSNGAVTSGTYPITVQGLSGAISRVATFSLTIAPSLPAITLQAPAQIAVGDEVPVLVLLAQAAPAGGIDVALANSNISAGSLSQDSTFIPGGQSSSSRPRLRGIASGIVTITGSAPGYQSTTIQVQVGSGSPPPPPPPTSVSIITPALIPGQTGTPYSQQLQAVGGTGPYTWTLVGGTLPAGLTLSPGGLLSGTPTATAAGTPLMFKVTDSSTPAQTAQATFALTITAPVPPPSLTITTAALPNGQIGSFYSLQLQATGGTGPYTWLLLSGSLPPNMTFSSGGLLSGVPATALAAGSLTFKVTDAGSPAQTATKVLTLTVTAPPPPPLIITTLALPSGQTGSLYSQQLQATGGTGPYTWTLLSGTLPTGITISPTGLLSGTPTTAAAATPLMFKVTDAGSPAQTAQATFALTVIAVAPPPVLTITNASLPNGQVGAFYSQQLFATGGTGALSWQLISGSLPPNMNFSSGGLLSGVPATTLAAGSLTFKVTDSGSPAQTASKALTLTITVAPPTPLTITTLSLLIGQTGSFYSQQLLATGGTGPYTWQLLSGALPTGMSFNAGGLLSGTPTTTAFNAPLMFQVTDASSPAQTATTTLSLTIAPPLPPPPPGPQIMLSGPPTVSVGSSARLAVVLPFVAPAGGTTLLLSVNNPAVGAINQDFTFIPEGQSSTSRPAILGLSPGFVTVTVTGTGLAPATFTIQVTP